MNITYVIFDGGLFSFTRLSSDVYFTVTFYTGDMEMTFT